LKQLQNFEKSITKVSIHEDNSIVKPLSQSSKRVIFNEQSITQSKSPSPVKNIKYSSRHYDDDDGDDDDGDDDDDDDEGIGWSPFVVSGI
jgi:hypothetical protein